MREGFGEVGLWGRLSWIVIYFNYLNQKRKMANMETKKMTDDFMSAPSFPLRLSVAGFGVAFVVLPVKVIVVEVEMTVRLP